MYRKRRTLFCKTVTCLLLIPATVSVYAAEWKIEPTLSFSAGYTDNIRLASDNKTSTADISFRPSTIFSVNTPTSGANGVLNFDFRRFEADSNLNDDNVSITSNFFRNLERSRLGVNLGFVKDTTLDSQLDSTGVVFDRIDRQSISIGPNWTYALNARTNVSSNYKYRQTTYKNANNTGLVDSAVNSASMSLTRSISSRLQGTITLSGTRSNNDNDVESTNFSIQGGASYQFDETWSTSLFIGARRTEVNFSQSSQIPILSGNTIIGFIPLTQDISNNTQGITFNANISKAMQRGNITLTATRSINNDINGQPIETTSLRPSLNYKFSETLSGNLDLQYTTTKADTNITNSLDQASYQISPSFSWSLTKLWSLSGSYRYRKQSFDNARDDATQNVVNLALTYIWPRIAISR